MQGSGNCPECSVPIRRNDFRVQIFDDNSVDKEVHIRRKIMKDFFKREDDFETLAEYNDYLEEVESMVYDLTYGLNTDEINRKIEQYKKSKDKKDERNKRRHGTDLLLELDEQIEFEKRRDEQRRKDGEEQRLLSKQREHLEKERLIDQLSYSESDAKTIVNTFSELKTERELQHRRRDTIGAAETTNGDKDFTPSINTSSTQQRLTHFSSGQAIGLSSAFKVSRPIESATPLYVHKPLTLLTDGPEYPTGEEIAVRNYASFLPRKPTPLETASGLHTNTVCTRLLQEAMAGLYFSPHQTVTADNATAATVPPPVTSEESTTAIESENVD